MSAGTPIQWCDDTCNPTSGCDGCELYRPGSMQDASCYALFVHLQRLTKAPALKATGHYAPSFSEVRMIPGRVAEAARRKDLAGEVREGKEWLDGLPRLIFVGDLSDIFSKAVTNDFLEREVFAPMESEHGRRHIWIVLTKRPARMADFSLTRSGGLPRNCIAMTSVTDQRTADARLRWLLNVRARGVGVSAEPLLGPVDLTRYFRDPALVNKPGLDWVICGGESGAKARECDVQWLRSLVHQARAGGAAPFVKQLGSVPVRACTLQGMDRYELLQIDGGSKGGDWTAWPQHLDDLRVRQMPDLYNERAES